MRSGLSFDKPVHRALLHGLVSVEKAIYAVCPIIALFIVRSFVKKVKSFCENQNNS